MTFPFRRPPRLREGDTVAVVSISGGAASLFPGVYELGLRNLERRFGLRVKEYPTARAEGRFLYENPIRRAEDVNAAFADPDVKAILSAIGGDDSVRILPHLDADAIQSNPKVLMGFSDFTTLLIYANQVGLVTFHGPAVMAGFSQLASLSPDFSDHIQEILFRPAPTYVYRPYSHFSDGYPDWGVSANLGQINERRSSTGWTWLQGDSIVTGHLTGGCADALEFLKGTPHWPASTYWDGAVLFLETSEEKPLPHQVQRWLRNYGSQGILDRIVALLIGRPRGYSPKEKQDLDERIRRVVATEFGKADLPIVTNLDFGHTDPQLVLPLGVPVEVNCRGRTLRLLGPAVA
jgi:muramoyltetrapeptide carboxypeptidase LdcA involved in peptidoglycan recycling